MTEIAAASEYFCCTRSKGSKSQDQEQVWELTACRTSPGRLWWGREEDHHLLMDRKARGSHQGSRSEVARGHIFTWAQSGRCCPSAHHTETLLLPPIPRGVTPIQAVTSQMSKGRQRFNLPSIPQTSPPTPTRALFPSS